MKIAPAQIERFTQNPPANLKGALLYGPDYGLINTRAKTIASKIIEDPSDLFCVVEFNYKKIAEEPAILADEINAMSLTGGRRLIKVTDCPSSFSKDIIEILSDHKSDSFVIFIAGELTPASAIRKFSEKDDNFASIACYKDETANIKTIVANKLRENGFNFTPDVITHLSESFFGDRMIVLNETEKLMIYMGEEKNITYQDAKECIMDSSEAVIDDLCSAITARNPYEIERNLKKSLQDLSAIGVIRIITNYFMRLQLAKSKITNGQSEQQALSALRPPVFFKQAPAFKRALQNWSLESISRFLTELTNLEIDCKTTNNPADLICSRVLTILPLALRK